MMTNYTMDDYRSARQQRNDVKKAERPAKITQHLIDHLRKYLEGDVVELRLRTVLGLLDEIDELRSELEVIASGDCICQGEGFNPTCAACAPRDCARRVLETKT